MATTVFKDIEPYKLHDKWIAYQADGRAEEDLGNPVIINKDREGWLASGHIGRVIPKTNTDVGWLFLALKSRHSQIQLKARASGSVVDSIFPNDMESVGLPSFTVDGKSVIETWDTFAESQVLEDKASSLIDLHFLNTT